MGYRIGGSSFTFTVTYSILKTMQDILFPQDTVLCIVRRQSRPFQMA